MRFASFAKWEREKGVREAARMAEEARRSFVDDAVRTLFPDLAVKHGAFRGMKYPEAKSAGSTLFPKLLGCYERELSGLVERICARPYDEIVDVGCGEGYYAVGLALRIPSATVYAYDIYDKAVELCRRMADLNGVGERVVTGSSCDAATLRALPGGRKVLIISDCEGYEKELFSEDLVPALANYDLLIETHDFIDIDISSTIRRLFANTHACEVFQSIDDIKKAQTYAYDELAGFSLSQRKMLLREGRPAIMEWLFLTPL
jgi:hypothetical protein